MAHSTSISKTRCVPWLRWLVAVTAVAGLTACASTVPAASKPSPVATSAPARVAVVSSTANSTLQAQFVSVVKAVSPSVVQIETDQGLGSGIVFDASGDIVTNSHVVAGATSFRVTSADGKQYPGTLVGTFTPDDLAVIRVAAGQLTPAVFGDSTKLETGDIVFAIGNPLGLQSSVTEGIVSAVGRTVSEGNGVVLPDILQTSASINPGNSGGALANLDGQVVGIPTLAAVDQQLGGSAPGIGFAISSSTAVDIANQLIQQGRVTNSHRAYLGIHSSNAYSGGGFYANTGTSRGAYITAVDPAGPAAKGGLAAGDVITAIDGRSVTGSASLAEVLAALRPGQAVKVDVQHQDGTHAILSVTLGQLPG